MEDEKSISKKVRSAVTDTGLTAGEEMSPGVATLFEILDLSCEMIGDTSMVSELKSKFAEGKLMYSRLKDAAFESLMAVLRPIQARRAELAASGKVEEILAQGAERARALARENIATVRKLAGLG